LSALSNLQTLPQMGLLDEAATAADVSIFVSPSHDVQVLKGLL